MKHITFILLLCLSLQSYAQFAVKNYSNVSIDQLSTIKQIADWIQFHQIDNVYPLFSNDLIVDKIYLNIESSYLAKEFSREKIVSNNDISVIDERDIIWYERNIYKKTKTKLKPRYQIYFTIEYTEDSYKILDLQFGKKKKINTSEYDKN